MKPQKKKKKAQESQQRGYRHCVMVSVPVEPKVQAELKAEVNLNISNKDNSVFLVPYRQGIQA